MLLAERFLGWHTPPDATTVDPPLLHRSSSEGDLSPNSQSDLDWLQSLSFQKICKLLFIIVGRQLTVVHSILAMFVYKSNVMEKLCHLYTV